MADTTGQVDRTVIYLRLIDKGATVLLATVRGLTLIGLAYYAAQAIGYLAGRQTDIFISYLTDTVPGITISVSVGFGGFGIAYGLWYRRLYRRAVAHFAPLVASRQHGVDPNRSSTGLQPDGSTNPDDL